MSVPAVTSFSDSFELYGLPFRLTSAQPDVLPLFRRLYHGFSSPAQQANVEAAFDACDEGFCWRVGERNGSAKTFDAGMWALEAVLCESIIEAQRRRVPVHGGAVYSRNSAAVVFGKSGAGKTTLSVAMAKRGVQVASDDVTLIEPSTLNLNPLPRCFHLDARGVALLQADGYPVAESWSRFRFLTPFDLNANPIPQRGADFLIFLSPERAKTPALVPMTQAEMAAHLFAETGQGPIPFSETIPVLTRMAGAALCYRLIPGPLTETADLLAGLLQASAPAKAVLAGL
jgi:hypothetical protein